MKRKGDAALREEARGRRHFGRFTPGFGPAFQGRKALGAFFGGLGIGGGWLGCATLLQFLTLFRGQDGVNLVFCFGAQQRSFGDGSAFALSGSLGLAFVEFFGAAQFTQRLAGLENVFHGLALLRGGCVPDFKDFVALSRAEVEAAHTLYTGTLPTMAHAVTHALAIVLVLAMSAGAALLRTFGLSEGGGADGAGRGDDHCKAGEVLV